MEKTHTFAVDFVARKSKTDNSKTQLMSPGMNDTVKIPLSISRKTLWMVAKIIELGISGKDDTKDPGVLAVMDKEIAEELKSMADGLLEKGGLLDLNAKLNAINTK